MLNQGFIHWCLALILALILKQQVTLAAVTTSAQQENGKVETSHSITLNLQLLSEET